MGGPGLPGAEGRQLQHRLHRLPHGYTGRQALPDLLGLFRLQAHGQGLGIEQVIAVGAEFGNCVYLPDALPGGVL